MRQRLAEFVEERCRLTDLAARRRRRICRVLIDSDQSMAQGGTHRGSAIQSVLPRAIGLAVYPGDG